VFVSNSFTLMNTELNSKQQTMKQKQINCVSFDVLILEQIISYAVCLSCYAILYQPYRP
jgi:hypothetical protein